MCRLGWVVPLLLAGCSTAPVAGLKDSIDSHRRDRAARNDPRPPPGGVYDPVSRPKSRQPEALPVSHTEPAEGDPQPPPQKPKPKTFDPANKVKQQQAAPPPPKSKAADPDDPPPAKPKPKSFDPASKVKSQPAPAARDDSAPPPSRNTSPPPAQPASRPAPRPSDERDDF